jgi:plastocyanin
MHACIFVVIVLLGSLAGCAHDPEDERPLPKRHTVRIEGMVFQPAALDISAGDSVVWVNKDLVPHAAATANTEFDSKVLEFNKAYTHTFTRSGEYEYVCPFHPAMKGRVRVR